MTIAIGFVCADSLLICADTQLTVSNVAKLHGSKIFREDKYGNGAKSAIAIAGSLSYARMAMQHIEERIGDLPTKDSTLKKIRGEIEEEIWSLHKKYLWGNPYEPSVSMLISVWSPVDSRSKIFWSEDASVSELRGYQPIGVGSDIAHYTIKQAGYKFSLSGAQVRPIAIKAIGMAKDWVDGCSGFTELISLSNGGVLSEVERIPTTL